MTAVFGSTPGSSQHPDVRMSHIQHWPPQLLVQAGASVKTLEFSFSAERLRFNCLGTAGFAVSNVVCAVGLPFRFLSMQALKICSGEPFKAQCPCDSVLWRRWHRYQIQPESILHERATRINKIHLGTYQLWIIFSLVL